MTLRKIFARFFMPGSLISLYYLRKFGCQISPRAEVELSPLLTIGKKTAISSFTKIKATDGPLKIGARVHIATSCFIASHFGGLQIGDDCMISPNVSIIGNNYRYDELETPFMQQGVTSKGIVIGRNVWIGSGACILDGARIGNNVIITPNSVVSAKVPDNTILQGNPAKVIFTRR